MHEGALAQNEGQFVTLEDIKDSFAELLEGPDCDVPVESPRLSDSTTADSSLKWSESSQTVIFLDWDDTLFPTTTLFQDWGLSSNVETWDNFEFSEDQKMLMERWREALFKYLKSTCSVSGRCVIITNARRPWVTHCIDKFAPNLKTLFSRYSWLRIVYARETLQRKKYRIEMRLMPGSSRGSPARLIDQHGLAEERQEELTKAKLLTMRREASKFYSQYEGQTWKNIISVGDARYERDAAWDLTFRRKAPMHECLRRKTIATPVDPHLIDLTYRLEVGSLMYPMYVKYDGDFDIDMNTPQQLGAVADALGMPELAPLIHPFGSELKPESLSEDLDDIQFLVSDKAARLCTE